MESAFAFAFTSAPRAALALFFEKPDRFYLRRQNWCVYLCYASRRFIQGVVEMRVQGVEDGARIVARIGVQHSFVD